jgi:hypothetical protein
MQKYVFLVSGQGGDKNKTNNTFAKVAWLRAREIVTLLNRTRKDTGAPVGPADTVDFVHFRCHLDSKGNYPTVEVYTHSFATERSAPAVAPWRPISDDTSFIEWQPVRDKKQKGDLLHAVSIVNLYHSVRRAPAGSVLEVSIFSHAFVEGPVLTNTDAISGATMRSRDDTDGRASTDFTDTMGEDPALVLGPYVAGQPPPTGGTGPEGVKAIDQFRKAFAPTGSFRVWGCNIQDVVIAVPPPSRDDPAPTTKRRCYVLSTSRQVIEEAFSRPLKKGGLDGSVLRGAKLPSGMTKLELDMGAQMKSERDLQRDPHAGDAFTPFDEARLLEVHYNAFPEFFKPDAMGTPLKRLITPTLSEVAQFVTGVMMLSYGFAAAKALPDTVVFAGAPGTSADLTDEVQLHIAPARVAEARFFALITQTSLQDDFALEQRRYSKLDALAVRAIEDVNMNGLP